MRSEMMTSGGDSSSSEPGSPSRPITPHHMTIAPVPAYECLRADSEDSGLGPSPAKSLTGPTSPEGSVSPIRFDDRSDSLLDLSPRTDNSDDLLMSEDNNGCCESCQQQQTATAIPQLTPGGSSFQFLIASKNCVNKTEDEDFCMRFTTHVTDSEELVDDHMTHYPDEELHPPSSPHKTFDTADDCSDVSNVACVVSSRVDNDIRRDYVQESLLNPKVVLIRSDFGGQYTEESCSQQSSTASTEATADSPQFEDGACKWVDCDRSADDNTSSTDLLDHLRQCHVQNLPEDAESFACLWVGCKVYARPSCSRSWLQRHVLLHGGSKPFRCIVAGCRQRFGTEAALQRHVNSHFPHQQHPSHHNNRLARARRRQHYKNRKRPQSHKSKDYFDDATMELVRHNLFQLSSVDGMTAGGPPSAITFHSTVKARRISESGKVNLLLHWSPENMVPDAWVAEDELCLNFEKTIPVSQLPHEALQLPVMDVFGSAGILSPPGKCKRK